MTQNLNVNSASSLMLSNGNQHLVPPHFDSSFEADHIGLNQIASNQISSPLIFVAPLSEAANSDKNYGWFFDEVVTHASVAKSIIQTHGERLKWASDTKDWYQYDNSSGYWRRCATEELGKICLNEIELLQERVRNNRAFNEKVKNDWNLTIQKANSAGFTKGVVSLLASVTNSFFKFNQLDSNPYLVGLTNGKCLDLKMLNVRTIEPTDNLNKSIGATYDLNATCPLWERSVLEWCCGDKELALFLQTLVGYSLSGLTTDHRLYFLYGNGKNGKSVFINILSALFYQNGLSIDPSSLMDLKRSAGQATGDIARLVGKRFISSNELPNNGMFNEEFVKRFTAGDTIVARSIFGKDFEFTPIGKLFISGNNQPIIRGRDEGIWRRMTLIPFNAKISSPDSFLDQKLKQELPGILNWAMAGWMIFAGNGMKLITPQIIIEATAQYRNEMDILARWKNDCLKLDSSKKLSLSDIYASYKEWCTHETISVMSSSSFNRETKNMFEKKREKSGYFVYGYSLGSGGSTGSM
jgi:putative DNA primase/helicase